MTKKYCSVKERLTSNINELLTKKDSSGLSNKEKKELEYSEKHLRIVEAIQNDFPPLNQKTRESKKKSQPHLKSSIKLHISSMPSFNNSPSDRAYTYLKFSELNSNIARLQRKLAKFPLSRKARRRNIESKLNGLIKRREILLEKKAHFLSR